MKNNCHAGILDLHGSCCLNKSLGIITSLPLCRTDWDIWCKSRKMDENKSRSSMLITIDIVSVTRFECCIPSKMISWLLCFPLSIKWITLCPKNKDYANRRRSSINHSPSYKTLETVYAFRYERFQYFIAFNLNRGAENRKLKLSR